MSVDRTKRNKERRMAKHAMRYPQRSTKTTAERRAIGKAWKAEFNRRFGGIASEE